MDVSCEIRAVLLVLLICSKVRADYVAHSDGTENSSQTIAFTILIVFGVVFAVQVIVFMLFACKAWDAVYGSRSVRADPVMQGENDFPFLPSYDMAMSSPPVRQQSVQSVAGNASIDNGVIVDMTRLSVDQVTHNRHDSIESIGSNEHTLSRNDSIDNGVVMEIGRLGVNTS